jgi:hypothetical protein
MVGLAVAGRPDTPPPEEGAASADSVNFRMAEHRWVHRLLFVFAPSRHDERFKQQVARLSTDRGGMRERDLLLISVVTDGPNRANGQPLTADAAQRLRVRFGVGHSAFRTVLIGKDGAEKRRDAAPVTARSLFDTIDAMPMRQREMREGGGGTP